MHIRIILIFTKAAHPKVFLVKDVLKKKKK